MRYFLSRVRPEKMLEWLLDIDPEPRILPFFSDNETALVVTHLMGGAVVAEVVTHAAKIPEICGRGLPLGRLYFQIPKSEVYKVCPRLTPAAFGKKKL